MSQRHAGECIERLLTQGIAVPAFTKNFPKAGGAFLDAFVQGQVRSSDVGAQNRSVQIEDQHRNGAVQRIRRFRHRR